MPSLPFLPVRPKDNLRAPFARSSVRNFVWCTGLLVIGHHPQGPPRRWKRYCETSQDKVTPAAPPLPDVPGVTSAHLHDFHRAPTRLRPPDTFVSPFPLSCLPPRRPNLTVDVCSSVRLHHSSRPRDSHNTVVPTYRLLPGVTVHTTIPRYPLLCAYRHLDL